MSNCREQLEALGPSRETKEQQQKYLLGLATKFQDITSLALNARYAGDGIFEKVEGLKVATSIVTRNEEFSNAVWKKGHTVNFNQKQSERPLSISTDEVTSYGSATSETDSSNRYMDDIEDLMHKSPELTQSDEEIIPWLKNFYTNSRGFELGRLDTTLIAYIWKKQSVNWDDLALEYISNVIAIVHCFIRRLLDKICPDERILKELASVLLEELMTRYQNAIDQVKFIIRVERAGTPLTFNHYFNENLEKW